MSDDQTFQQHCIVELLGHRTLAGLVSETTIAGVGFLRIDIPRADGSSVTKFVAPKSIYEMHPCSEDVATETAHRLTNVEPVKPVDWSRQLPERRDFDDEEIPY
jgi:hypothetical protein